MLEQDRFVAGVRALAHSAHPVESGNAKRRGEVAVGSAAGCGFVERKAELGGERLEQEGFLKHAQRLRLFCAALSRAIRGVIQTESTKDALICER